MKAPRTPRRKAEYQYIFQTKNPTTPALSLAPPDTAACRSSWQIVNMLKLGTVLLIADSRICGELSVEMAHQHGGDMKIVKTFPGTTFTLAQFTAT